MPQSASVATVYSLLAPHNNNYSKFGIVTKMLLSAHLITIRARHFGFN